MENNKNNLTKLDKQRILKQAKEYCEIKMNVEKKKSSKRFFSYIVILCVVIAVFYLFAIYYRHYLFLKMGL